MTNLLPCPFCNGKQIKTNEIQHNRGCFMVLQAMPRPDTTSAILWEAWNTRAPNADLAEAVRIINVARDSVEECVQEHHAAWGERLMHKQLHAITNLREIDNFLARVKL